MTNPYDHHQYELQLLAPYAMKAAQSQGRRHVEPEGAYRSVFQRDRDRIIHCQAFRRLMYKTQVYVIHEGDYYRTRLTHTLEVAQIARTIARAMQLNEDLVEAVALVHDVGHPPFGHAGEVCLNELMAERGGFEHNRHGLRVVEVLEHRYPEFRGLNLTYEVREAIAKHSTRHDTPAPTEFDDGLQPVLEAQIVELADSIAYDSHDLDDALRMGIIALAELDGVPLCKRALESVYKRYGRLPDVDLGPQVIRYLIDMIVTDVIGTSTRRLQERGIANVDDVRRAGGRVVAFSEAVTAELSVLEALLMKQVYRHYRVMRMTTKGKKFMSELFNAYLADTSQLPPQAAKHLATEDKHRVICDYIAGMTDRFAQDEYQKLFFPFERV